MLIKLTSVPHPDVDGGKPKAIYVDASRILVVEPGSTEYTKRGSMEQYRQALQGLFEEVQRVAGEAGALHVTTVPETSQEANQVDIWIRAKESAAALTAAYQLVSRVANEPMRHPPVDCTVLSLACGTAFEHGVMLSRVFVTESPEEVHKAVEEAVNGDGLPR